MALTPAALQVIRIDCVRDAVKDAKAIMRRLQGAVDLGDEQGMFDMFNELETTLEPIMHLHMK